MWPLKRESPALHIDGLAIELQRRRVRHLYLRVHLATGSVRVVAPPRVSDGEVRGFVVGKLPWIRRQLARLAAPGTQLGLPLQWPAPGRAERERLRLAAHALLPNWEARLGVRCSRLTVRRMRSRWGSCSPQSGAIRLSTELLRHPPDCLEYVLVHELVHLLEPSHNARFRGFMDQFLPDWRARRQRLRTAA